MVGAVVSFFYIALCIAIFIVCLATNNDGAGAVSGVQNGGAAHSRMLESDEKRRVLEAEVPIALTQENHLLPKSSS